MTIHNRALVRLLESLLTDAVRMNELLAARATLAGGVFTVQDALACGYDRQALSRLAGDGSVVRIGRGAYASRRSYVEPLPSNGTDWPHGRSSSVSVVVSRPVTIQR